MGETDPFLSTHPHLAPAQDALTKRRMLEMHEWMDNCRNERLFAPEHAQPQV